MSLAPPTPTIALHTLPLHDALPISCRSPSPRPSRRTAACAADAPADLRRPPCRTRRSRRRTARYRRGGARPARSEEHTSELQSHSELVCRLLLEKKKKEDRLQSP